MNLRLILSPRSLPLLTHRSLPLCQLHQLISATATSSAESAKATIDSNASSQMESVPIPGTKPVLLVTASTQLRALVCAILRRFGYSAKVVCSYEEAIETGAAAGCGGGTGERFAVAVVDLDLVPANGTPGNAGEENGPIQQLRAALWGEGGAGFVVGVAPSRHATPARGQVAEWTSVDGFNNVLQR
jgi:hypothetical protein